MRRLVNAFFLSLLSFGFSASAADTSGSRSMEMQHGMQGHSMQQMQSDMMTAAQQQYHAAMQKMDKEMMQGMMDPDPAKSWIKQMIAHHQGAIDMSEIALKEVKDGAVVKEARKTREQNQKDKEKLEALLKGS